MEVFEKAFNCKRKQDFRRREFSSLNSLLSNGIPDFLAFYTLAQTSYTNGNYSDALSFIDKTIRSSDIDDWKYYAFKANVLEDMSNFSQAITFYRKAIEIEGTDVNVYALYHQIAFCYSSMFDYKNAIDFYTYAIELKKQHKNAPNNPDQEGMEMGVLLGVPFKRIYVNRGQAFFATNKYNESILDCETSLSYDKSYSNPYLLMAQIHSKIGNQEKAVELLIQSAQLGNQNAAHLIRQFGL